jgi:uncharacterized membrane protein
VWPDPWQRAYHNREPLSLGMNPQIPPGNGSARYSTMVWAVFVGIIALISLIVSQERIENEADTAWDIYNAIFSILMLCVAILVAIVAFYASH